MFDTPNPTSTGNDPQLKANFEIFSILLAAVSMFALIPVLEDIYTGKSGGWTFFWLFMAIPACWLPAVFSAALHWFLQLYFSNPWWPYESKDDCLNAHRVLVQQLSNMGEPILHKYHNGRRLPED